MRRLIVPFNGEALADLVRNTQPAVWQRVVGGIPVDATYCGVHLDQLSGTVLLVFEHPSFPDTRPGDHFPFDAPAGIETRRDELTDAPQIVG